MKIVMIGDVVGESGRKAIKLLLPEIIAEHKPALTIVNAENAAAGYGLTPAIAHEIFAAGANILTSGNHIWDNKQILDTLRQDPRILRPANYPEGVVGQGWTLFQTAFNNVKVGVLNLEGRVYMHDLLDPFTLGKKLLEEIRQQTPVVVIDFHAEVTSEKRALGWYLDGLASAVVGTHTHVQTADEEVLPQGTAYLTDMGMTGSRDSVIGITIGDALHRFLYQTPCRLTPAGGRLWINGAVIDVDPETGKALSIARIQKTVPGNLQ